MYLSCRNSFTNLFFTGSTFTKFWRSIAPVLRYLLLLNADKCKASEVLFPNLLLSSNQSSRYKKTKYAMNEAR